MFTTLLKNQRVTFVGDVAEAEKHSPYYKWFNPTSGQYVVSQRDRGPVAAGLNEAEADACVMFKANEYIYRALQNDPS